MNMFSSSSSHQPDSESRLPDTDDMSTPPSSENTLLEVIRFSVIALLIVVPIRMFIAQPFIVSGASMADTFHTGEYLIVDQVSYYFHNPRRGDVIIFRYPKDPSKYFIKRVVGLPGDTIVIENAQVTIKNEANPEGFILDEPYIRSMRPAGRMEETLGPREYFVMGDNRDESSDSRMWGVLQEDRIIGRAFLRLFPLREVGLLPGAIETTETTYQIDT